MMIDVRTIRSSLCYLCCSGARLAMACALPSRAISNTSWFDSLRQGYRIGDRLCRGLLPVSRRVLPALRAATSGTVHSQALLVAADLFFYSQTDQIVELEARHRVPIMCAGSYFPKAGGLI
jgi:hypothetical protein